VGSPKKSKIKKPVVYAFIDSQNLNLGVRASGWKLDFRKFRHYLTQKYKVERAYLFVGLIPTNAAMYTQLQSMGYIVVFKPTLELPDGKVKGNVDAELVLHAMIQYAAYDKAIIVSGDGDFYCLVEYLDEQEKLLRVLTPNKHFSSLLRAYNKYVVRVDLLQKSLEYKKTEISGRSKP
jgi:uncharacterized LabA/DUF88 family protein